MEPPPPPPTQPDQPSSLVAVLRQVERSAEDLRLEFVENRRATEEQIRATNARQRSSERAHRLSTAAIGIAVAAALAGSVVNYFLWEQAREQRRLICEEANERALSTRDGFKAFTDALVAAPPPTPRTAEEQAVFDARVAAFREDLNRRLAPLQLKDCSPVALGLPTPKGP